MSHNVNKYISDLIVCHNVYTNLLRAVVDSSNNLAVLVQILIQVITTQRAIQIRIMTMLQELERFIRQLKRLFHPKIHQ